MSKSDHVLSEVPETPAQRLDRFIANGNLVRLEWGDGFETACLLGAMSPQCSAAEDPDDCPASVCPTWWAQLTVNINDNGSYINWMSMVQRYASLAHRWRCLSDQDWQWLQAEAFRIAIELRIEADDENGKQVTDIKDWLAAHKLTERLAGGEALSTVVEELNTLVSRSDVDLTLQLCLLRLRDGRSLPVADLVSDIITEVLASYQHDSGDEVANTRCRLWDEFTDELLVALAGLCDEAEKKEKT